MENSDNKKSAQQLALQNAQFTRLGAFVYCQYIYSTPKPGLLQRVFKKIGKWFS